MKQETKERERIKTLPDKSSYLLNNSGKWVRNFTQSTSGKDINKLYDKAAIRKCIENETAIRAMNLPGIDLETKFAPDLAIVSDGYDINSCREVINSLGKAGVTIIGVNGVMTCSLQVRPSFYLINSTGPESMGWFPNRLSALPALIASVRTYPEFVSRYKARRAAIYSYVPTGSNEFCSKMFAPSYTVDDYRNPICAALNLAFRWGTTRILLLSPHDLFTENRPATEKTESGLYIYPQQVVAHNFIDSCLYWINQYNGCEVYTITSGPKFKNAETVSSAEAIRIFTGR